MPLLLIILVTAVLLYIGYNWGKTAEKDRNFGKDVGDSDDNLSSDQRTMLLLTQQERYELGKAMAIGNKSDIKKAKDNLEKQRLHIENVAIESKLESLKRREK